MKPNGIEYEPCCIFCMGLCQNSWIIFPFDLLKRLDFLSSFLVNVLLQWEWNGNCWNCTDGWTRHCSRYRVQICLNQRKGKGRGGACTSANAPGGHWCGAIHDTIVHAPLNDECQDIWRYPVKANDKASYCLVWFVRCISIFMFTFLATLAWGSNGATDSNLVK